MSMGAEDDLIENDERFDVKLFNMNQGWGYKNAIHYLQLVALETPAFQRYDHGDSKNHLVYGQPSPPEYNLEAISFPISIASGTLDNLCVPKALSWLSSKLGE